MQIQSVTASLYWVAADRFFDPGRFGLNAARALRQERSNSRFALMASFIWATSVSVSAIRVLSASAAAWTTFG